MAENDVGERPAVTKVTPARAEGDAEALLYVAQIVFGIAAWLVVLWVLPLGPTSDLLGYLAMCAATYPFARRTWAADLPARHYWTGALFGAAIAAGLRNVF